AVPAVRAAVAPEASPAAGPPAAARAADRDRGGGGAGRVLAPAAGVAGGGRGGCGLAGRDRGVLPGPDRAGTAYPRGTAGDGRLQPGDPAAGPLPLGTRVARPPGCASAHRGGAPPPNRAPLVRRHELHAPPGH